MRVFVFLTVFVSTFIAISHSNPDLRKGEIMEAIITKQTQGNYEEAINLFAIIGKLAKNHTADLSDIEQKLFFNCYHLRRIQLRNGLLIPVESPKNVFFINKDVKQSKLNFYALILETIQDLDAGSTFQLNKKPEEESHYIDFFFKVETDKRYFETRYEGNRIYEPYLKICYEDYERVLRKLRNFLSDAEPTVLDTCLGLSTAKLEYETLISSYGETLPTPCDFAQDCLVKGRKASTVGNPDLVPLTEFVSKYCKPDSPDIIRERIIYSN